jgi:hypothetical protein
MMANIPNQPDPDQGEAAPASADDLVTIPRAELEALLARLDAAASASESAPRELAAGDRPRVPVRPGDVPGGRSPHGDPAAGDRSPDPEFAREIAARDRRLADLEQAFRGAVRDRELATALAGRPLVSGAASQLLKLWRDDLDVFEEDGGYKVAAKDGRAVAQAVGEWLASPEFAHFCLPTSRGGTGARGGNRPPADAAPGGPKNLGEAVVMKWREASTARPENLLKPIGLRRHR